METPTITIGGKVIGLPPIKARLWKEIMKFHTDRKNIKNEDLVDTYCGIIAIAFGVTTDEVLDNLDLKDVGKTYYDVFDAVVNLLTAKTDKKNEGAAD